MLRASTPSAAAWRHVGLRDGFEVVRLRTEAGGLVVEGSTSAVEDGVAWTVGYELTIDPDGRTRRASIRSGSRTVTLALHGSRWTVEGDDRPDLDGCVDIDLESSAFTNALPVDRLALGIGQRAEAPAVYVRARDLSVVRLEQTYERTGPGQLYAYSAPAFDFACDLEYDDDGLVSRYPGLAVRML